jgi:hypothetical protein
MLALLIDGQRSCRSATPSGQLDPLLVIRAGRDHPDPHSRPDTCVGHEVIAD